MSPALVVGVDVGGTNIEAGLVRPDHQVLGRRKAATPAGGPDAVLDTIEMLVGTLGGDPVAVGVGVPGVVHGGEVLTVPNLPGWIRPIDLATELTKRLDLPVALGNDANVGLLGEWVAGSAAGAENVLGVWLGTGVGGGLILGGQPFTGVHGAAGEIGHVLIRADGALCHCGRRGCVEAYAGRRAMEHTVGVMVGAGCVTSLHEIRDRYGKARLTSKVWARALAQDDPLAVEVFAAAVEAIGIGVANAVVLTDVDTVVVGGGLAEKLGQGLADRIATAAQPWLLARHARLRFIAAALGDDSGVVGAAALARRSGSC
ncbi:ROK family protein [Sporichthya sp.]|uniref:ROK family protein n=1 Tax=Sporichthya sp. TaxID=65475 RepID=UPI00179D6B7D|nr:ROK family protein [Sporichthya sp.]MBA3742862.1 ROK family protein [Sporichthya sp.]